MKETTVALQCAACGAPLDMANAQNGLCRCKYCSYTNITTRDDQTEEVLLLLHEGEAELRNSEFERAYNAFKSASELDEEESRAYFGMALASNKIKYIKDIVNKKYQPICFEVSEKRFDSDKNFSLAVEYASTDAQVREYESRALEIDYIREKFYDLKRENLTYDTFICVKVSDGEGGYTKDSVIAGKLYDSIKRAGLNPFYSERDIGDRVGEDYEALILYALYSAKSFIIVCSNEDYLRTPWVQNEYTRYHSMLTDKEKSKNSIMIAFDGEVIERVPGVRGKIQGVDLANFDSSQKICEFVKKFADSTTEKKIVPAQIKEESGKYCAKCGTINSEDSTFCSLCGHDHFVLSNEKYCTKCDTVNTLNTKYCSKCGGGHFVSTKEELEEYKVNQEIKRKKQAKAKRVAIISTISLVAVALLTSVIIFISFAIHNKIEDRLVEGLDITISEDGTYYSISGTNGNFDKTDLKIPEAYRKIPIKYINTSAFQNHSTIVSVDIPDSVIAIGSNAFKDCSNLKNIDFGNGVNEIGDYAFSGCTSIEAVNIPTNVTVLGSHIFYGCRDITISCQAPTKPLDWAADWNSENLSVTWDFLDSGVSNDGLYGWVLSNSGIAISHYYGKETNLTIPSTLNSAEVVTVLDGVFKNNTYIQSLTIPNSITKIGNYAFAGCGNLKSVSFGSNVNTIGASAFADCNNITEVRAESLSSWLNISFSDQLSNPTYYAKKLNVNGDLLTEVVLPSDTKAVNDYAFINCTDITKVVINVNTASIEPEAFTGCENIKNITIGKNVTKIKKGSFKSFAHLENIIFEDTSGWRNTTDISAWESSIGGFTIGVADTAKNVTIFRETFSEYYFFKIN